MEPRVKSSNAFLTISEVSDLLGTAQHIIRFWETKFPQIRPLKRAGGRRYFRPEDVTLLQTISRLLAQDGYTIRGVQKLLREGEIKRAPLSTREETPLPLGLEELDITYSRVDDEAAPSEVMPLGEPVRTRKQADDKLRSVLELLLDELVEMKKSLAR